MFTTLKKANKILKLSNRNARKKLRILALNLAFLSLFKMLRLGIV